MSENPIQDFLDRARSYAGARAGIAALELDLFPALADGPKEADALISELGLAKGAITDTFVDLLVTAGFLDREGSLLSLTEMSRSVLGSYQGIQSWGREMAITYRCLDDLEGLVRTGEFERTELARFWSYKINEDRSELDPDTVSDYSNMMDESQEKMSEFIASAYDFSGHERLMEFGGGYGRLAMELARSHPNLGVTIADLPIVCEEADRRIEGADLSDRVSTHPCDFFHDELPEGVTDVVLFCRVLHDWKDHEVADLMRRTKRCLRPGGVAIAVEPMFDESETLTEGALPAAMMLALLGGRRRSVQAYESMFSEAGYASTSWRETGQSIWRMVVARSD